MNKYQKRADKICQGLALPLIPIIEAKLKRRTLGTYDPTGIEICTYAGFDTVLHELAHHLEYTKFFRRIPGYFKVEKCPQMEECSDRPGWYAATGPLHDVYYLPDRSHGKVFKKCLREIEEISAQII